MLVLNILLFFILVINTNSQFLLVKLSDSNRPDGFRSGGIGPGKIENGGIDYNELARKDAENSESNFSEQGQDDDNKNSKNRIWVFPPRYRVPYYVRRPFFVYGK